MSVEPVEPATADATPPPSPDVIESGKVLLTGTGFVGREVVRELVGGGYEPVCLVRNPEGAKEAFGEQLKQRVHNVKGDVLDGESVSQAAQGCVAAIHLVGIIEECKLAGRTFEKMHVQATRTVVRACETAGVRRYVHMSALGTRPEAISRYHQTKWEAEQIVQRSSLAWTIFRPSLIHGPQGEFMQMMKFFATSKVRQPVMPYFGSGRSLIQPVSVRDVAAVFVKALRLPESIGQVFELGGPERFTWKELYDICAEAIAGKRRVKISVPVPLAKLVAMTVMPLTPRLLVPYKFNVAQVQMSQEDSICNTSPTEKTFGIALRDFRTDLREYADMI